MERDACDPGEQPWQVLGVSADADQRRIRQAYLEQVKQHPPDRADEQFQRVRDAYEELSDPRRRARRMVRAVDPRADMASLLEDDAGCRRFVGPAAWLSALKEL